MSLGGRVCAVSVSAPFYGLMPVAGFIKLLVLL